MKVIKNSAIVSVSASSEDAVYPATNLLDSHPKKKWKAADSSVSSAIITVEVRGKTGGLGMVGIIADAAAVHIEDPAGITWDSTVVWDNVDWDSGSGSVDKYVEFEQGEDYAALWSEFEEMDAAVAITVTLYKDADNLDTLAAGVVVCGEMTEFSGVLRPLNEGLKDYSIVRELANGAEYYRRRDIVRTFSGQIRVRTTLFWDMMRGIARKYGRIPMMYRVLSVDGEWVIYAKLSAMPSGVHDAFLHSLINFQLEEVL